jgi:hypothetical protein
MAWKTLDETSVLSRLTDAEVSALKTAATRAGQPDTIAEIIGQVVQDWRGLLRRHHVLAEGSTIPSEIESHVLAEIRYRLFTRLPGMKSLLDERRVEEWTEANRTKGRLKNYVFEDAIAAEATAAMPQAGIELTKSDNRIFTREKLAGL